MVVRQSSATGGTVPGNPPPPSCHKRGGGIFFGTLVAVLIPAAVDLPETLKIVVAFFACWRKIFLAKAYTMPSNGVNGRQKGGE